MRGALGRNARRSLRAFQDALVSPPAARAKFQPEFPLLPSITVIQRLVDQQWLVRGVSSLSAAAQEAAAAQESAKPSLDNSAVSLSALGNGMQHYGKCYWELSKARLSMLVVMTSGAGYVLGSGALIDFPCLGWTCLGTMLAASSANSFNQIIEMTNDAGMKRTMRRPLPSGRMSVEHAFAWAVTSGVLGVTLLACKTNSLVALLGVGNIVLYTMAYTPLKQIHPANTWVGALVGAVPPLMGWAAASGQLDPGAWVLAAALYYWQLPHFMALAFMCSKDYVAGGYKMVSGNKAAAVALRNCLYLLPVGFVAHYAGVSSSFLGVEAAALALGMGYSAVMFYQSPTSQSARYLFRSSLLYLPLLMLAMLVHRVPNHPVDEYEEEQLLEPESNVQDRRVKLTPADYYVKPPIGYASAAPFPFLPAPKF